MLLICDISFHLTNFFTSAYLALVMWRLDTRFLPIIGHWDLWFGSGERCLPEISALTPGASRCRIRAVKGDGARRSGVRLGWPAGSCPRRYPRSDVNDRRYRITDAIVRYFWLAMMNNLVRRLRSINTRRQYRDLYHRPVQHNEENPCN